MEDVTWRLNDAVAGGKDNSDEDIITLHRVASSDCTSDHLRTPFTLRSHVTDNRITVAYRSCSSLHLSVAVSSIFRGNSFAGSTHTGLTVLFYCFFLKITGPPTHDDSVGGKTSNGRWRLSSSSVVCNTRICNVTHQGQQAAGQSCYVHLGRHLVRYYF